MEQRLKILMENENLTVGKLADMLGVKPAGISHILKGRNNPNFELTAKIVSTFKRYNPYWLLGYSEQIFKTDEPNNIDPSDQNPSPIPQAPTNTSASTGSSTSTQPSTPSLFDAPIGGSLQRNDIDRIIVVYSDKTFEAFTPKR